MKSIIIDENRLEKEIERIEERVFENKVKEF